jgi:hypothetical protein
VGAELPGDGGGEIHKEPQLRCGPVSLLLFDGRRNSPPLNFRKKDQAFQESCVPSRFLRKGVSQIEAAFTIHRIFFPTRCFHCCSEREIECSSIMSVSQFWTLLEGVHLFCQRPAGEGLRVIARPACSSFSADAVRRSASELEGSVITSTACAISAET